MAVVLWLKSSWLYLCKYLRLVLGESPNGESYSEQIRVLKTSFRLECSCMEWLNRTLCSYQLVLNQSNGWTGPAGAYVSLRERWNSWTVTRRPKAKAFAKNVFINQERKSEVRRRLDTAIVLTLNNTSWRTDGGESCLFGEHPGNESISDPGVVWLQSWNLKELTEEHHQEWSLRLNLTQHGKPHPARTP